CTVFAAVSAPKSTRARTGYGIASSPARPLPSGPRARCKVGRGPDFVEGAKMSHNFLTDLPAWPTVDHSDLGPVERRPLGRIQKLTAGFLARNWVTIP